MHFVLCPDGRRLFCSWLSQLVQKLFKVTLNEGFTGVLLKKCFRKLVNVTKAAKSTHVAVLGWIKGACTSFGNKQFLHAGYKRAHHTHVLTLKLRVMGSVLGLFFVFFKKMKIFVCTYFTLWYFIFFCRSRTRLTRMRSDLVITLCPRTSYMSWNTLGSSNLPSENQKEEK